MICKHVLFIIYVDGTMGNRLEFSVVSQSTGEVYFIELYRSNNNLTCTCTCPAGQRSVHCKHRLAILKGDVSEVDSGDADRVSEIAEMLKGTDVEVELNALSGLEQQKRTIENQIKATKKALGKALND